MDFICIDNVFKSITKNQINLYLKHINVSTQVLTYAKTYFNKTLLTKSFKTVLQSTIDYSYVLTETSNQQKQHGQIRITLFFCVFLQLFYSFFKSLIGKDVVVELKNDLSICGTLHSVDQYLNIKLTDISVTDPDKYPHMLSVKNCFIRGSVVRYVQLPGDEVDTQLLQDAARKEAAVQAR
ncbi:U6 snRNA-associated Sm-like protein LSm2 [Melipona quadrifasciata]|uniref:U6 snRNA-associated Sm-like protein LSm2 n=2 Tax=Apocrita TaxID=7400 RepID=A0A0M9A6F8_9HYME|nr:U6 snRNA-associated Sm-like protein LSm2 [Melipona quadrifasciata]